MADYDVIILPEAENDLLESADYYLKISEKVSKAFLIEVDQKLEILSTNPSAFQIRYRDYHTIPLSKFPFLIHYFLDENAGRVEVLAILHTSRNSDNWPD
jgi:plasmid stabilization system protein ParE